MTYRIVGLSPEPFQPLFALNAAGLMRFCARRVTVTARPGFPCRVSLVDAAVGEEVLLLHHISHDVATPYRSAYAIYVRADVEPSTYVDTLPPVFEGRPMAFRAFDAAGMLRCAALAEPGEADTRIRDLFANADIAYIHAHNAAHGCFAARVDRT